MKPDFKKIANDMSWMSSFQQDEALIEALKNLYLAGRKAQVKIDAEIAINYPRYFKIMLKAIGGRISDANLSIKTSQKIAKAIEGQDL